MEIHGNMMENGGTMMKIDGENDGTTWMNIG